MDKILTQVEAALTAPQIPIFKLFFAPSFRSTWLLVTKEMVCDHIGYAPGMGWQRDFIKRVVEPNLDLGRQYQEIPADHPLVEAYFSCAEMRSCETTSNRGHGRKYYMITGDAFQDACMMAGTKQGKIVRGYFKTMADLATRFMREHAERAEADKVRLEEENKSLALRTQTLSTKADLLEVASKQQIMQIHHDFVGRLLAKKGRVYIATNYRYGMDRLFKIGSTSDMRARLTGLNTSHPCADGLEYVYDVECDDIVEAERRLARYAKQMRDGKEFYKGDFQFLRAAVDIAICGVNEDYDRFSGEVRDCMDRYADDPLAGIDAKVLQKIKPRAPLQIKQEELVVYEPQVAPEYRTEEWLPLINAVKDYCTATKLDWRWDEHAHSQHVRLRWKELKPFVAARADLAGLPRIKVSDRLQELLAFFRDMLKQLPTLQIELR
jgi:hypothetical protein